jgi:hypothetical protein
MTIAHGGALTHRERLSAPPAASLQRRHIVAGKIGVSVINTQARGL